MFKHKFSSFLTKNHQKERLFCIYGIKLFEKFYPIINLSVKMPETKFNLKPPQEVAGLTILDRQKFEKTIKLPCLRVETIKLSTIMPQIKKLLFKLGNFKPVRPLDNKYSEVFLNCDVQLESVSKIDGVSLDEKEVTLQYENYSLESVLKAILPSEIEGLSSFTQVGHLVHVNLREHLLPYKDIIAQILFDKVPKCKTVVNKSQIIDNTYRNFHMEVLRGEANFLVQVKENKCTFDLDFSKVYWNSRLCTEHERIVNLIQSGCVVFDVFAGVGPFSVPLAKKKCQVFANDLNPESFKWLINNRSKNRVEEDLCKAYNKDAKDFILEDVKQLLPKFINENKQVYILMNLPALAVEFLQYFVGLLKGGDLGVASRFPIVIVYCFAKGENPELIAKNLLSKSIGWDINNKIQDIFRVRTVSNYKEMMRLTFNLDEEILLKNFKRKHNDESTDLNTTKRCHNGQEQEEIEQRI